MTKSARHEPGGGEEPACGRNSLTGQSHDEGTQHQPDDLRADVLHLGSTVQAHGTGDITLEAGDAKAHVSGVAQLGQHQSRYAHQNAGNDDQPILFFHYKTPLSF